MRKRILVVDDEVGICESLVGILEDEGYEVDSVENGEDCMSHLQSKNYSVVLLDIWLPSIDGLETLDRISNLDESQRPVVVMISGHGTIETAVKATKLGALDFLEKPLSLEKVTVTVKRALEHRRLLAENTNLRAQLPSYYDIIGESVQIKALRQQLALMAPTNGRILIFGESGVGKELVARALHAESLRSDGAFIEVNCAAIPEELIESELFGHRQGSFAGAHEDKTGKFQKADGGTLFLDEVGDMSLKTQAKVLRVLEEQRFEPLGLAKTIQVDTRVIAATNKDLEKEIRHGNFREDLFYRLNVIPFQVPPLRERTEDIPLLAEHFLDEFCATYGRQTRQLTSEASEALSIRSWPGNVRELRNLMERVVIMTTRLEVGVAELGLSNEKQSKTGGMARERFTSLEEARKAYERDYVMRTLQELDGNMSRTAEALGLERSHLYRKMKALGINIDF
ncbi:MAG: Fis family transcriptional regulator [Solibacterales bacterium]|nr:Fis family transcriptional regulator [Bryobacterales bacterium]|tara:strand:- start:4743 stop:6107 length:1365 start_codon:yes stop_codon:yes gene_type:complete